MIAWRRRQVAIDPADHYHSGSIPPAPRRSLPGHSDIHVKRSITTSVAAVLAALALAQPARADGDPERGARLGVTCLGCHGVTGYRNAYPSYRVPKLGGQKAAYVQAALKAYRDRKRPHPTMQAQASSLTDQDIADVAAWVSSEGAARDGATAETIDGLEAARPCVGCHGKAGANVSPAPPVLSGQHREYLEHALGQYKEQQRGMTVMSSFAATLSQQDIERVAAFYSSLDGLQTLDADATGSLSGQ
jgi:cytochrome c553